jgi:hypothetical protein
MEQTVSRLLEPRCFYLLHPGRSHTKVSSSFKYSSRKKAAADMWEKCDDEERRFVLSIRMIFLLLARIRPIFTNPGPIRRSSLLHHHCRPLTNLHHRSCTILIFHSITLITNCEAPYLPFRRCTTIFRAPISTPEIHFHQNTSAEHQAISVAQHISPVSKRSFFCAITPGRYVDGISYPQGVVLQTFHDSFKLAST